MSDTRYRGQRGDADLGDAPTVDLPRGSAVAPPGRASPSALAAAIRERAGDPRDVDRVRLEQQRTDRVTPQEKRSIGARLAQLIEWLVGSFS